MKFDNWKMKQKISFIVFALILFTKSFSQAVFEKYIRSANSQYEGIVKLTGDGGYIALGTCANFSGSHSYACTLAKLNWSGDTIWTKNYSCDTLNLYGKYIEQTNDRGYIILAQTDTNSNYNNGQATCLIKIDSSGNIMWNHQFRGRASIPTLAWLRCHRLLL